LRRGWCRSRARNRAKRAAGSGPNSGTSASAGSGTDCCTSTGSEQTATHRPLAWYGSRGSSAGRPTSCAPIAAISISGPASRLTKQRCVEFVPQMRRAAGDLAEAVRGHEGLGP